MLLRQQLRIAERHPQRGPSSASWEKLLLVAPLMKLKQRYTIVIVTHNMQQAARVSDRIAFMSINRSRADERVGVLVEYDETKKIFTGPSQQETEDYISGRFG